MLLALSGWDRKQIKLSVCQVFMPNHGILNNHSRCSDSCDSEPITSAILMQTVTCVQSNFCWWSQKLIHLWVIADLFDVRQLAIQPGTYTQAGTLAKSI